MLFIYCNRSALLFLPKGKVSSFYDHLISLLYECIFSVTWKVYISTGIPKYHCSSSVLIFGLMLSWKCIGRAKATLIYHHFGNLRKAMIFVVQIIKTRYNVEYQVCHLYLCPISMVIGLWGELPTLAPGRILYCTLCFYDWL